MSSEPRSAVLSVLRASDAPLAAPDVAQRLGIHTTTARFHLRNLVDDGKASALTLRSDSRGRPRTGYVAIAEMAVDPLLSALFEQLGTTASDREEAAARAGRAWASALSGGMPTPPTDTDLPDPVTIATDTLRHLGFRVSDVMSAFGTHEIRICSCPLRQVGAAHPEVARGIARGAIEFALASGSPTLADHYGVTVTPAPDGDCEITLRLSRRRSPVESSTG
ncbi:transcriptional regulator [Gordonia desulfuricans]|uniref:Transcriptional regulator n=1 Tax=Gordonia desulfuricans TaxID=89051 RepID=A0A7K3LW93_9ACTN|nr:MULTISPECIES: helix-turn-helix domain-containing protein [Gordonia]KOY49217.1 transcriptional regulator [Gordonia sp. NB41Y]NDK92504.1 transcriptional regulator [Gordonia desulfuricans]WLP92399.1 transcriptional regulator [Gordonia sp. NB41Y]